jgi:hypothetical protein
MATEMDDVTTADGSWAAKIAAWFWRVDFRKAIWLAPLVWALHEAEEWNIDEFERANFVDPGYFSLIDRQMLWLGLAQVALQGVILTALTAWPRNSRFAAFLTLPVFIVVAFGNVLTHAFWVWHFGGYTPGAATAVLLVGPVVVALTLKAVHGKLIPWWYAALFYLATVPGLLPWIQSPNEIPAWMQRLHMRGLHTAAVILGRDR